MSHPGHGRPWGDSWAEARVGPEYGKGTREGPQAGQVQLPAPTQNLELSLHQGCSGDLRPHPGGLRIPNSQHRVLLGLPLPSGAGCAGSKERDAPGHLDARPDMWSGGRAEKDRDGEGQRPERQNQRNAHTGQR